MVYALGMLGYWVCGFALQMGGGGGAASLGGGTVLNSEFVINLFGKEFGLFGTKGFFLSGGTYDVVVFTIFLFQMVFMDTTATIPTGAMAERWTFKSFCIYALFISGIVYPLFANWVWGGGWLSQLGKLFALGHGHVDFAGSSVVHMTGGVAALAGAMVLGPRLGKFKADGTPNALPGHHIPMALAGCFILAFGWFGFNAGSTRSAMDGRLAVVAANTMIAGAAGAVAAYVYAKTKWGKADPSWLANGMLAGLVSITASCAYVSAWAAALIAAIGGVLAIEAAVFIDSRLRIDDPVGASAVHGVSGAWGVLALGLFANGTYGQGLNGVASGVTGLFYGDGGQLVASVVGIVANVAYVGGATALAFWIVGKIVGNRVSAEDEIAGLDLPEMGVHAYSADPGPAAGTASPGRRQPESR
jgi:Amt family ammonium transporter